MAAEILTALATAAEPESASGVGLMTILTWAPAIILPLSTGLQWWRLWRAADARGVSVLSWGLFGVANIGAYALACEQGHAADIRPILAFLLSAALDVAIVVHALRLRLRRKRPGDDQAEP